MSRHLRVLRKAGLVREVPAADDDARARVYELAEAPFRRLSRWVAEVEAFWSDQLDAFKAHAEGSCGRRT
jgi:DNA-binding transcriptional ArsR family regulator